MKIIWLTDIHLDYVNVETQKKLLNEIVIKAGLYKGRTNVLITGDIGNSNCTRDYMLNWKEVLDQFNIGLYFVLGNHDYYGSSVIKERDLMRNSLLKSNWLPSAGVVKLTEEVALVGHDGWYDGGYANWFQSQFYIPDYTQTFEMNYIALWSKEQVFDTMNVLAREAAAYVFDTSVQAINNGHKVIYIATHVPPFRENTVYRGLISDDNALPHFSSKHMGDTLLKLSSTFKDVKFTVMCGHSHGDAKHIVPPNMICHTAQARNGHPCISRIIDIND
jgi:predicted phosphohydrolase